MSSLLRLLLQYVCTIALKHEALELGERLRAMSKLPVLEALVGIHVSPSQFESSRPI